MSLLRTFLDGLTKRIAGEIPTHRWVSFLRSARNREVTRKTAREVISRLWRDDPDAVFQAVGPCLNRTPDLDHMPFDLPVDRPLQFEHLAGLFSSTSLDHGVISMTVRQAAYLFGLIRLHQPRKVIEVGRYKGGGTFLIAAAMAGEGELWSIDNGEKERRLYSERTSRAFDTQLADVCQKYGLGVHLIAGDARTVEVETGEVDLVVIDGDHTYAGVRSDFERFGLRLRPGGALLLDDAFAEGPIQSHSDTVGRLVAEVTTGGGFRVVKAVNRMAHLERTGP